jgi:hypothetical protein
MLVESFALITSLLPLTSNFKAYSHILDTLDVELL